MEYQSLGKAKVEIESLWMIPASHLTLEEAIEKLKENKYQILEVDFINRKIKVK